MPERVAEMTKNLFARLLETGGPEQKSIIFCARDRHADAVSAAMNNLYAEWCTKNGKPRAEPYAFKCTSESGGGDFLPGLRAASRHHFVATTVDLLTTGVDVPAVRNIVFFKYVRSPTSATACSPAPAPTAPTPSTTKTAPGSQRFPPTPPQQ